MNAVFDALAGLCGSIPMGEGLIAGLFLAGLAGSPLHCGPMCGGFVLGQVADRMADLPTRHLCEWRRIGAGALLPYHMGRVLTYAVLGAAVGLGGSFLDAVSWVPTALLALAAGVFVAMAWRRWRRPSGRSIILSRHAASGPASVASAPGLRGASPAPSAAWLDRLFRSLAERLGAGRLGAGRVRGLPLGLALGFLPCGFLYAALLTAAASRDPWTAAAGMAAFGAGTVPALVAVGIAGHAAGQRWRSAIASVAPFILVANAALLALLAVRGLLA